MTAPPLQEMGEFLTTVKVPCSVCKKVMSFRNVRRHMKTVHYADGKKWTCSACGKISQSEPRLKQHQRSHNPEVDEDENIFKCPDCPYRTLCKNYLVDHKRLMHNQTGSGQYICVVGKCFEKPMLYPNQAKLDKHRTCHENKSCTTCGKVFGAKRNLRRHEKNKHEQNQGVMKKNKHEQNQMNISTNSNTSDGDDNGNAPIVQLD